MLDPAPEGMRWVITPHVRDRRTGKLRFPTNGRVFCFLVPDEKHEPRG